MWTKHILNVLVQNVWNELYIAIKLNGYWSHYKHACNPNFVFCLNTVNFSVLFLFLMSCAKDLSLLIFAFAPLFCLSFYVFLFFPHSLFPFHTLSPSNQFTQEVWSFWASFIFSSCLDIKINQVYISDFSSVVGSKLLL